MSSPGKPLVCLPTSSVTRFLTASTARDELIEARHEPFALGLGNAVVKGATRSLLLSLNDLFHDTFTLQRMHMFGGSMSSPMTVRGVLPIR